MGEIIIENFDSKGNLKKAFRQERRVLPTGGAEIKKYVKSQEDKDWKEIKPI